MATRTRPPTQEQSAIVERVAVLFPEYEVQNLIMLVWRRIRASNSF